GFASRDDAPRASRDDAPRASRDDAPRASRDGPHVKGLPVSVVGWGSAVPDARLSNAELETRVDTNDAWIVERTGIRERRIAAPGETASTLGTAAAADAIKSAGL